ncbi:HlyD family secretion protein [Pseudomonas aeruginosa]|uniref:HlyD family secretion protein n=1 Tax=Pseudomonas aeruginosa TaxID=287 RepID=UPI003F6C2709
MAPARPPSSQVRRRCVAAGMVSPVVCSMGSLIAWFIVRFPGGRGWERLASRRREPGTVRPGARRRASRRRPGAPGRRPGQPVELEVDTFGRRWRGRVDSVAPASGAVFALLPPDNATGNFTKIVQRFPVRIRLDADAAERGRLLPGMSVIATVDTREPDGASADER